MTPDAHAIFALLLTVGALFLFTRDRIPLESSCLFVLVVLVLVFQIFPYERNGVPVAVTDFFAGFGHEALVTIAALMVVGRGLETTGALRPVALFMSKGWKTRPVFSFLATLVVAAALSAFLNNTPIVVMLLPILVSVAIRNATAPSEILMPMGLATLVGGMATTIGTSTNLLVVGIAADLGLPRMGMFYFTLPVLLAGSVGILFLWLIAPRLLPERRAPMGDTSPRIFNAVLYINEDSFANGKTLSEVLGRTENRMAVSRIQRGEGLFVAKLPSVTIQPGDRLYINDTPEMLKEFEQLLGATLHQPSGEKLSIDPEHLPTEQDQQLAEVVVTRGSLLHHRTLKSTRFTTRFRLVPLAIHRARTHVVDTGRGIDEIRLRAGDVLLVQGSPDHINGLKRGGQMLVLDGTTNLPHTKRANTALGIIAFVVISAATGLLPISVSALTGVALMILTRCIDWRNAAGALSTPVILIIVASLGLGIALMRTGGAEFVAHLFVAMTWGLPVPVVLSGLMLLVAVLTNVVSNNAAAVIGTPIAVSVATEIGASPEAFVLAVLFGANMSFATPMGYQTNLLVFSAGGYKFSDFLRVGIPLTIIMWLAFSLLMPFLYELTPAQ
ncbi:MAG: SLC13 family permease [Gammaproteobacteria bacterium]|nr:SLC13 family permease [Gammaproteobacteria bacterium]NNF60165.1 SLC13 family permease [Gammaproteobacteria bacterium]NNM21578.1 SLC13 family permease [Gammaproteobacteria bacterium]